MSNKHEKQSGEEAGEQLKERRGFSSEGPVESTKSSDTDDSAGGSVGRANSAACAAPPGESEGQVANQAFEAISSDYRQWLISAEHKAQDDFDKAVLSLSGGALGVSFIFVKDIVGPGNIVAAGWLLGAWVAWAFSSLTILASYFFSHLSLRKAIQQCDDGTIYGQTPGGVFAYLTGSLNAAGAILFFSGVLSMSGFVYLNIDDRRVVDDAQRDTTQVAGASPASARKNSGVSPESATGR